MTNLVGHVQDNFVVRYQAAAAFSACMAFANFFLVVLTPLRHIYVTSSRIWPHLHLEPTHPAPREDKCGGSGASPGLTGPSPGATADAPVARGSWLVAGPSEHAAPRAQPHQPSLDRRHRLHQLRPDTLLRVEPRRCHATSLACRRAHPAASGGAVHEAMLSTRSHRPPRVRRCLLSSPSSAPSRAHIILKRQSTHSDTRHTHMRE